MNWLIILSYIFVLPLYGQNTFSEVYNLNKDSTINDISEFKSGAYHLWSLTVNEHGNLDKNQNNDIIKLSNLKTNNEIKVGTKWTYESKNHPRSFVKFQEYIVKDSIQWKGEKALVIEPGLLDDQDYMLVKNNKVYFWDNLLDDYQLNYDFENDSSYYINYFNQVSNQVDSTIVYIDSMAIENINGMNHSIQYCSSTLGVGNIEMPFKIINKVGNNYGGPHLPVGFVIDNITNDIQRIRCFENDTIEYTLTEVECDSTWITTSSLEIQANTIQVYPNPTDGNVFIEGIDQEIEYELYFSNGKLIKKGIIKDNSIVLEQNGIHLLRLKSKNNWILKRIIKLE